MVGLTEVDLRATLAMLFPVVAVLDDIDLVISVVDLGSVSKPCDNNTGDVTCTDAELKYLEVFDDVTGTASGGADLHRDILELEEAALVCTRLSLILPRALVGSVALGLLGDALAPELKRLRLRGSEEVMMSIGSTIGRSSTLWLRASVLLSSKIPTSEGLLEQLRRIISTASKTIRRPRSSV